MTMRLQTWPGVLLGTLLMAALMMLAVACGSDTQTEEEATTSSAADTTSDAAPEIGNRVGNLAPDFSVTTTDGVTRSLTDFKQANQPVVVYFFASW